MINQETDSDNNTITFLNDIILLIYYEIILIELWYNVNVGIIMFLINQFFDHWSHSDPS